APERVGDLVEALPVLPPPDHLVAVGDRLLAPAPEGDVVASCGEAIGVSACDPVVAADLGPRLTGPVAGCRIGGDLVALRRGQLHGAGSNARRQVGTSMGRARPRVFTRYLCP